MLDFGIFVPLLSCNTVSSRKGRFFLFLLLCFWISILHKLLSSANKETCQLQTIAQMGKGVKRNAFSIAQTVITQQLLEWSAFTTGRRQSCSHLANTSFRFSYLFCSRKEINYLKIYVISVKNSKENLFICSIKYKVWQWLSLLCGFRTSHLGLLVWS
jgi:hypothetical protein